MAPDMDRFAQLPCDADGICMRCKSDPPDEEVLLCDSCNSPWHMACLLPPMLAVPEGNWDCPDCADVHVPTGVGADGVTASAAASGAAAGGAGAAGGGKSEPAGCSSSSAASLAAKVRALEEDKSLTEEERARKRQQIVVEHNRQEAAASAAAGSRGNAGRGEGAGKEKKKQAVADALAQMEKEKESGGKKAGGASKGRLLLDETMNCMICLNVVDRPVTTPCGHNSCLKCFTKWVGQGKRACAKCRAPIPPKMVQQPRINSLLVSAIRYAKLEAARAAAGEAAGSGKDGGGPRFYQPLANEHRPDKAFTTDRAVKTGKANACSGRIFVTIPPDHFGPITSEYDPERKCGVLVGETWADRLECRQWGAHFPHVAGIAGQSDYGAQSVALSGGYEDDEDNGEWFLYTGSGGRDLSGNKRTNKHHSFDQKFVAGNEALRVSCKMGFPVRVVRSHKEKRSSYAPESGVRYDGIYRIERCWRKPGAGGYLVCRYLFVRCDNEAAPWTSEEHGDRPRALPKLKEMESAQDVMERKETPAWDWNPETERWGWTRSPPASRKLHVSTSSKSSVRKETPEAAAKRRKRHQDAARARLLKEFKCRLCSGVLCNPVSTPCGHSFCKECLEKKFEGQGANRQRGAAEFSGRSLRKQRIIKPCPVSKCGFDLAEYLESMKVNYEMAEMIDLLKKSAEAAEEEAQAEASAGKSAAEEEDGDEGMEGEGAGDGAEGETEEESPQGRESHCAAAETDGKAKQGDSGKTKKNGGQDGDGDGDADGDGDGGEDEGSGGDKVSGKKRGHDEEDVQ